jgi:hypothetical protein
VECEQQGARGGERQQGKRKVAGFIGMRRPKIWQAGTRRCIGLGLVFESRLPGENGIGLTSGSHNLASKEKKEEIKKGGNNLVSRLEWRVSSVMDQNRFG